MRVAQPSHKRIPKHPDEFPRLTKLQTGNLFLDANIKSTSKCAFPSGAQKHHLKKTAKKASASTLQMSQTVPKPQPTTSKRAKGNHQRPPSVNPTQKTPKGHKKFQWSLKGAPEASKRIQKSKREHQGSPRFPKCMPSGHCFWARSQTIQRIFETT